MNKYTQLLNLIESINELKYVIRIELGEIIYPILDWMESKLNRMKK